MPVNIDWTVNFRRVVEQLSYVATELTAAIFTVSFAVSVSSL